MTIHKTGNVAQKNTGLKRPKFLQESRNKGGNRQRSEIFQGNFSTAPFPSWKGESTAWPLCIPLLTPAATLRSNKSLSAAWICHLFLLCLHTTCIRNNCVMWRAGKSHFCPFFQCLVTPIPVFPGCSIPTTALPSHFSGNMRRLLHTVPYNNLIKFLITAKCYQHLFLTAELSERAK